MYRRFVSPSGGACPCDPSSIEATKEDESCTSFHADKDISAALESTKKFADVDVTKYAGVLQAGGHGTCWDFPNEDVAAQTGKAWEAGLVVGSVCHGPVGLANVKVGGEPLVKGKKVCCFTNKEEEAMGLTKVVPFLPETRLTELGAVFVGAENWACNCQVDGKLVTGQNPASAGAVAKEMIKLM